MNKVYKDAAAALHDVFDGCTILAGGFGLSGNPENCIGELARRNTKNLTIVSNNCGTTEKGLGILLAQGQVKKMVSSYVGENKIFEQQFLSGQLEVELCPQVRSPSGCAQAAPASRRSSRRPATGRRSPRARTPARSTARTACSSTRSAVTSRS